MRVARHRTVLRRLPAPSLIGAPIAPTQHRRGANQTADRARTDSAICSREHQEEQERQRAAAEVWNDRDLMICTRNGRGVNQRNAHRSWTRMVKRAGVTQRGIHHLRHA